MRIHIYSTHGAVSNNPPLGMIDTGGQVVYVLGLAAWLRVHGHDVTIVTRGWSGHVDEPGIKTLQVGPDGIVPKERMYPMFPDLVAAALKELDKPDVVIGNYVDGMEVARVVGSKLDVPHIAIPHSLGLMKKMALGEDPEMQYVLRAAHEANSIVYADHVVATSPAQRAYIERMYERPAVVIPPAVDLDTYFPDPDAERGVNTVLAIARDSEAKNLTVLVSALHHLDGDWRLMLGGGDHSKLVEYASMLKVAAMSVGHILQENMAPAYRMATVFALPSLYEPFGMTGAEALACGTPLVASTETGVYSLLSDGIYGCAPTPQSVGNALEKAVVNDDGRTAIGTELVNAACSWDAVGSQIQELL
jgi:glycosyltransferase involved in cell wall biosynthesis